MSSGPGQLTLLFPDGAAIDDVPEGAGAGPRGPDAATQADGAAAWTATSLAAQLAPLVNQPLHLHITDNRHTMLTVDPKHGTLEVRLHRMFLHADSHTLANLARYVVRRDRRSSRALDEFIAEHRHLITRPRRPMRIRTRGRHHDLRVSLDRLRRRHGFRTDGVQITWGRATAYEHHHVMALGSYSYEDRTIRIHPVLDDPRVPAYFLDWIVYHELLHHLLPVERRGEKRRLHDARFRRLERQYPLVREAREWEKLHLPALLES